MLDAQDLQAIAALLEANDQKIDARFDKIDRRLDSMDARMDAMDARMDAMDQRFDGIDRRLDSMDEKFSQLSEADAALDQKIDRVAKETLEESAHRMRVMLENVVGPKFQLLAEGQSEILRQLGARSELESLPERVDMLETVAKIHAREISELK